MNWLLENKDWLFSGIGVTFIVSILGFIKYSNKSPETQAPGIVINNQNSLLQDSIGLSMGEKIIKKSLSAYKNETRILFIDDDVRFKVAKILVKSGWVHTKLVKDAETLDDQDIIFADILFVDVQGVGVALGFSDEGLGLALAIKDKYPLKKVVIYSAETKGDRFHAALRKADSFLSKNADPYEFQKIVEDFTIGARDSAA